MASLIHAPAFRATSRRSLTEPAIRNGGMPCATPSASISIAQVWLESLQVFSAHSQLVLVSAFFGLMSPFLIGHWIATRAVLQDMAWVGPVLTLQEKLSLNELAVLACAGWLTTSIACGVITHLALQGNARKAIRETLVHLPALLIGSLAYSTVIVIGLLGISPTSQNSSAFGQATNLPTIPTQSKWEKTMSKTGQQIAGEALTVILPDAGPPLSIVLPEVETALLHRPAVSEFETWLADTRSYVTLEPPVIERIRAIHPNAWDVIAVASFALLFLSEALLRFRMVTAFEPLERITASYVKSGGYPLRRFAVLSSLVASIRFGWRHYGVITLHIWVLRIASCAILLLMVKLPMAAALHIALPALIAFMGKTALLPVMFFMQVSSATLVAGIVLAFSTIYDARLFTALRDSMDNPDESSDPSGFYISLSRTARSSRSSTPSSAAHLRR